MKAHAGAALCSVEVTDGPSTRGPPADSPGEGVGSLAMQPSPVSQPSRTWLLERLSMEVGVDPGLNLVSCRHLNSRSHLIFSMGLKHTHHLCVLLPGKSRSRILHMRSVEGVHNICNGRVMHGKQACAYVPADQQTSQSPFPPLPPSSSPPC